MQKETTQGEIILYQPNESLKLEVQIENETVWLSQQQIAELFGVKKAAISKHTKNIFMCGELEKNRVVSVLETTASDGKRYQVEYYSLDMILSIGYRVNSKNATQFRIWANSVLKDHLLRGYSINRQLVALQERTDERFKKGGAEIGRASKTNRLFCKNEPTPVTQIVPYRHCTEA